MSAATVPIARSPEAARIGAAFKAARKARGVTLEQMAKALETTINSVRWHEAGATLFRADKIARAAEFLLCDPAELLGDGDAEQAA